VRALIFLQKSPHDFDALVKTLIQSSGVALRQLNLEPVVEWLNVELPKTQNQRVDLLGRMVDGRLLHIELQSTNDSRMPPRMAEYGLAILRKYGAFPVQVVIYVGNGPLRMKPEFRAEGMICWYRQVDIRDLDAAALLKSNRIADNILAVLAGLNDTAGGIRVILHNIAKRKGPRRKAALERLLLTCGLRDVEHIARKEVRAMPTNIDAGRILWKYDFIREAFHEKLRQKVREQVKERVKEQVKEKVKEQETRLLRLQLEKRFGKLPASVSRRLAKLTSKQTEKLAVAMMDATSLRELFGTR